MGLETVVSLPVDKFTPEERKALKRKAGRHKKLRSKIKTIYPMGAEREYRRLMAQYTDLLIDSINRNLPKIERAYKRQQREDSRFDDRVVLSAEVNKAIRQIAREVEYKASKLNMEEAIMRIARMTSSVATKQWKAAVRRSLSLVVDDDYYEDLCKARKSRWVADALLLVGGLITSTLLLLPSDVMDSAATGSSVGDMVKRVRDRARKVKERALSIARDAIGTLFTGLTEVIHADAGIDSYVWCTKRDDRVRECHASFEGKVFKWSDPPEIWYRTSRGIVFTGRHCHPGEDYGCRCTAAPVFNFATMKLALAT